MLIKRDYKGRIVIRVDSNPEIGLGHLTRCLALADMIKSDYYITIAIQNPTKDAVERCNEIANEILILPLTDDYSLDVSMLLENLKDDEIIILDGYHFNTDYQVAIKKFNFHLVCIDDQPSCHFVADAIINHNPGIKESDYSVEPYTKIYIGFDYALLRKEFLIAATEKREITKVDTAFICFGGSDPLNITETAILGCLDSKLFAEINVVTGSAYKFLNKLDLKFNMIKNQINFYHNVSPAEMVSLLKGSQIAICPSSSISLEVFCVGLNLVTGFYADNQKNISEFIQANELGLMLGDLRMVSSDDIKNAIKTEVYEHQFLRQKELMKGDSAKKIKSIFDSLRLNSETYGA